MLHTHSKVVYLCMCIICSVIVIVCYIQNIYDIIISFRRNLTRYALCAFSGTSVSAMRQFDTGMQNMWSANKYLSLMLKKKFGLLYIILIYVCALIHGCFEKCIPLKSHQMQLHLRNFRPKLSFCTIFHLNCIFLEQPISNVPLTILSSVRCLTGRR